MTIAVEQKKYRNASAAQQLNVLTAMRAAAREYTYLDQLLSVPLIEWAAAQIEAGQWPNIWHLYAEAIKADSPSGLPNPFASREAREGIAAAQAHAAQLEKRLRDYQDELEQSAAHIADLRAQLRDAKAATIYEQLTELTGQLADAQKTIARLQHDLTESTTLAAQFKDATVNANYEAAESSREAIRALNRASRAENTLTRVREALKQEDH